MFEKIEDVPVELTDFYYEDIRSEPTGEMVPEEFIYTDENGDEQTGSRQVPEYADVAYVVQKKRPQSVSWVKVDAIIAKHQGKRDALIAKFVTLAEQTDDWSFHDKFIYWLEDEPVDDEECLAYMELVDGELFYNPQLFLDAHAAWNANRPVKPVTTAAKQADITNAKFKRDSGQYAEITVDGKTFDCDAISYEKMKGTLASWTTLIGDSTLIELGMVVDGKLGWTLADNTVAFLDQTELQAVVDAIAVRAALLQAQYVAAKA